MAKIGLVLDCSDPERLAQFWAGALGYQTLGAEGSYVLLYSEEPGAPTVMLQQVPEPKAAKNRMHLDIETADIESEAVRLEALGARRLQPDPLHEHSASWFLMADPEGNEFCVCDGGA